MSFCSSTERELRKQIYKTTYESIIKFMDALIAQKSASGPLKQSIKTAAAKCRKNTEEAVEISIPVLVNWI